MVFLFRLLRYICRSALLAAAVVLSVLSSLWVLWSRRDALRRAEEIVLVPEGGFGHTLLAPDTARRLFPGKTLVVLIWRKPYHNPEAAHLFPDMTVIYLPFTWRFGSGRFRSDYCVGTGSRLLCSHLLAAVLKRISGGRVLPYPTLQEMLVQRCTQGPEQQHLIAYQLAWYRLRAATVAPPARLPAPVRARIVAAIEHYTRRPFAPGCPTCCLYLRSKGAELTSARRTGAGLVDHLPAISFLISRGYKVLLTGDRDQEAKVAHGLGPLFVTADAIGIERNLFTLFAATEAAIWIGNNGGGSSMPVLNDIPMLILDMFPFGVGYPNACLHYKNVYDMQGHPVRYEHLLQHHAVDSELPDFRVCTNSAAEILEAVRSFLDELGTAVALEPSLPIQSLPGFIFEKACNCRLSKPWLERHREGNALSRTG
ncbi:hypothetical protein AYO44_04320 [Planctomycetaceae bacterium SCGC AG-212-F19]|nr:hypothetical protein AYO44_04320 [Planctomycetaceae bacterium SCGC AG-212-F19]